MVGRTSKAHDSSGRRDERGFSLVDLLVGMAIAVVVLFMAIVMTRNLERAYAAQMDDSGAREEAQYAVEWIERALRAAGSNPYGVTVSTCPFPGTLFVPIRPDPDNDGVHDDIRINADINPPNSRLGGVFGSCTEQGEDITIAHNPEARTITLRDNATRQTVTMSDTVITGLQFTYLTGARTATTTPSAIVFVQARVTAQSRTADPRTRRYPTYTAQTEVRVRAR